MSGDRLLFADEPVSAPAARPRRWPLVLGLSFGALVVIAGGSAAVLARFGRPFTATPFIAVESARPAPGRLPLDKRAAVAAKEIERVHPHGLWIQIDTFQNRLQLVKDGQVIRSAVCSTGTGRVLRDPRNGRQWVFDTPLGERVIKNKVPKPVWVKPDWAFVEEGYLPPRNQSERIDDVSLGDYALYMGEGYIIHGTLFKSLLGRRVTHGCVRLGDEDLEYVYKHAPIGTRVYLY
jgi:L,D-transpeptidase YbiS